MAEIQSSQTVECFRDVVKWSSNKNDGQEFLTPVASVTMAPMGVSPLDVPSQIPHTQVRKTAYSHVACVMRGDGLGFRHMLETGTQLNILLGQHV